MWSKIILGIILIIISLFIFEYIKQKYIQSRQKADFRKIFKNWENSFPALEFGSCYGWPTFKVTFQNKNDLNLATKNKLTDDFKSHIQSYYSSKFDVDIAVHFTHID